MMMQTMIKPLQDQQITEWQTVRFDNCANLVRETISAEKFSGEPYIGLEHIAQERLTLLGVGNSSSVESAKARFKKGDVLYGKLRPYFRKVVQAPFDGVCSTDIWVLRAKEGIDSKYLFYLVAQPDFTEMANRSSEGTRMPRANWDFMGRQLFKIPDLEIQRSIASILGSLDDKIELNRQMNETLEQAAQALFKSWFVDFDPVRAKAEGRDTGLPKEIADLFSDSFEESSLGEIPRGWKPSTVGEEFNLTMGQSPPGETYNETGEDLPFFQGRTDFGFRYPVARIYCSAPIRLANEGDTLVSVRAPVGSVNMADVKSCVGRGVAAIRHKSNSRSFTYYFMRYLEPTLAQFEAGGTVFGSINKADFDGLSFIVPSERIIEAFEEYIFSFDEQVEVNEHQTKTLASIRDALLPKLLSGEIRI